MVITTPFDIVAYYESQACAALTAVAAVSDAVYQVSGDDLYCKPEAAFLGAYTYGAPTQATLKYGEVRQPSLKVPYRFYSHGDSNGTGANTLERALTNLFASPLPLYPDEKINAYVQNATNEAQMVFLWLVSGAAKTADIEAVDPTHVITGYADQALTAGSWTTCTLTWDQDLPIGRYAVVGMLVGSYKASGYAGGAARLILLDTTWRPGVMINNMTADKLGFQNYEYGFDINQLQRWPLMQEISFRHDRMPNIEICAGAANTDHVINLLLQKIE